MNLIGQIFMILSLKRNRSCDIFETTNQSYDDVILNQSKFTYCLWTIPLLSLARNVIIGHARRPEMLFLFDESLESCPSLLM